MTTILGTYFILFSSDVGHLVISR